MHNVILDRQVHHEYNFAASLFEMYMDSTDLDVIKKMHKKHGFDTALVMLMDMPEEE